MAPGRACYSRGVPRAATLALLVAGACADASVPPAADARPGADARPADAAAPADAASAADADPGICLAQVPLDYGQPTPFRISQSQSDGRYTIFADLVPESEPFQRLFVVLRPESGVFPGPVAPGDYVLEGQETDYQHCSACVYLAVNTGQTPSTLYMVSTGKLRLDSVGAEVRGELTSATLRQIEIRYTGDSCGGGGEWPCGNTACSGGRCGVMYEGPGCETTIRSLSF
jgi:hypothetical protein